ISGLIGPVTHQLCNMAYAVTAAVGGFLVVLRNFDIGGLAVSLNYTRTFNRPVNEISMQLSTIYSALAGFERIEEILKMEGTEAEVLESAESRGNPDAETAEGAAESTGPSGNTVLRGDIDLSRVTFGYVPDIPVLRDISLHARPGEKIALVGSTGAGKTTVTNLLTRFYGIDSGSITIDGRPIESIPLAVLRGNIAMVLQDTHLFTGTVRENIRYGRPGASDDDVVAAAKAASAHYFILRLKDGYDTVLTHDGASLSQGQRQLLGIARAAISHAPILILDEATSSVDTLTEKHIEEGMDALMSGRTTLVIAHRLSTVRTADNILVLEHGRILESGNHKTLLEKGGRYADLYREIAELD
ncbi:MAG: ABC transporter ATP-binding protein, partial [Lachnospiraceae bacterium]|nr:ABC transporter ATP-binding protein [Lachnospiraceae bacterium]